MTFVLEPPLEKCRSPLRKYCCNRCKFQSFSRASLKKHRLKHQQKSAHKCRLCSFSAQSAVRLALHVQRDHHSAKFGRKSTSSWTIPRPISMMHGRPSDGHVRPTTCAPSQQRQVDDLLAINPSILRKHQKNDQKESSHRCPLFSFSSDKNHVSLHIHRDHSKTISRATKDGKSAPWLPIPKSAQHLENETRTSLTERFEEPSQIAMEEDPFAADAVEVIHSPFSILD